MSTEDVVDGNTWQILQASPILHGAVDLDDLSVSDIFITQGSSTAFADAAISVDVELVRIISTMRTAANPSRGMARANNRIRNVRSILMSQIIDDVLSTDTPPMTSIDHRSKCTQPGDKHQNQASTSCLDEQASPQCCNRLLMFTGDICSLEYGA